MPAESQAWGQARERLSPFGVIERVENLLAPGFPDTVYCLRGVSGLLEMKADVRSIKLEQVLFAERWAAAGGLWHMLLKRNGMWMLYDAAGTRALYERVRDNPIVKGKVFPLKEIIRCLSPAKR